VLAVIVNLAGARAQQPHHHASHGGLAAAGLANHAQRFAALDIQIDAVDGVHEFLLANESAALELDLLQQISG
jgi:hypothetical protein